MMKIVMSLIAAMALSGCGDNLFATIETIDNSTNDSNVSTYYGDAPYDMNATRYDCNSAGYLYCGKCLNIDKEVTTCLDMLR